MKKKISIIIPAYNEEAVIAELSRRLMKIMNSLRRFNFEIIIIENGSVDNTLRELLKARKKDKRLKIVQLVKNIGCDEGIISGLAFAKGDAAIIMMADLQDVPELIGKFIQKWEEGYEIVYGIVKKRVKASLLTKLEAFIFYKIINTLTKGMVPENVSDFRLLDKKVYKLIQSLPEHNKFFRGLVMWSGFAQVGIPFERPPRFAGESKANFLTALNVAMNGILSFSKIPLRLSWLFFVFFLGLGIFSAVHRSFEYSLIYSLLSIIIFIQGVQSEYIARIFDETRNRPHFIVKEKFGFK